MQRGALAGALRELFDGLKESLNFRDLEVVEMLFYAQLRNKQVAQTAGMREQHVALIKHRCLKQIRQHIARAGLDADETDIPDNMLTGVWEELRLSCPKRSTIGAWMLGTLDPQWHAYVAFHVERLGCRFCQANLDDLREQSQDDDREVQRDRILESTVGFLRQI